MRNFHVVIKNSGQIIEAMLSLRIGIVGDCGVGKSALSMKICSLGSMSEIGVNLPFFYSVSFYLD